MTELKTLKVEQTFINYKVFSYLWLVNTLRRTKENVLFARRNINPQTGEVKPVQKNVGRKGNLNMIKNILNSIQKFQEKHLKIGKRIIGKRLIKEQEKDGEQIRNYRLETKRMNLLEKMGLRNMGNVSYVVFWEIEKPIISNTQRRILY